MLNSWVLLKKGIKIDWHGLEIDQRPLNIALKDINFLERWSPKVLKFFNSLRKTGEWTEGISKVIAHWGDARVGYTIELPRILKGRDIGYTVHNPSTPKVANFIGSL